jgi:two-component system, chemotaxis family, chemotaxis protein CheY
MVSSILLVDDSDVFRDAMAHLLEREGYRVTTATDGAEALDVLQRGMQPSLILLDLMMPRMNGLQFRAEQLRDPDLTEIPTAAYSTDVRMRHKAEALGLAFFDKPDVRSVLDYVAAVARRNGHERITAGGSRV